MQGGRNGRSGTGVAILLALLLSAGGLSVSGPAGALEVRVSSFHNGQAGAAVAFPSAGTDNTLELSIQTGLHATSVFFNLSGEPYTGGGKDCPLSPSLDLGADGDLEWSFNGTGYGALGHQYLFSDGAAQAAGVFTGAGTDDSVTFRLPAAAVVAGASFDLAPSGFAGPSVNVSVDIGADGVVDWSNTTLDAPVSVAGLESLVGAYLRSASPSGTDGFGVQYVDVPVRLNCGSAATLALSNLSVRYDATLTTANLALRLNALVPGTVGSANVTVPVRLTSESAGRLVVRDLDIRARSPLHAPDILDPAPPASPELDIDENQSVSFSVRVQDIYGDPVALRWYIDLSQVPGADGTSLVFQTNYTSSGRHGVTVTADNGLSESSLTWWVNVRDVNLAPVIRSFSPASASVGEGSPLTFSVDAYDPDGGPLGYTWTLDGRSQPEKGASFIYTPAVGTAGYHAVGLVLGDSGGKSTALNWTVLVRKTNLAPEIRSFSPASDPLVNEGETLAFSIDGSDPNGDPLTYEWVLEGYSAGFGQWYNFSPDFSAAGNWSLQALVRDGGFTVGHSWNITVADVNHAPVAVIDEPLEGAEFLDTDRLWLSGRSSSDSDRDALTFRWYDGEEPLAEGVSPNATLPRGPHRLRLVVEDGKGGRGESSVNITVRTVRISTNISLSSKNPREGDRLRIKVRIANDGDTVQRDLPVGLQVDGVPVAGRTISRLPAGENITEYFYWTAEPGRHDLQIGAGNESSVIFVSVAPGMPAAVYYTVFALAAGLLTVAALSMYFFIQWNLAVREGIVDETKRRGHKDLGKGRRPDDRRPLGFFNIRLGFSPYKEKPLEIKTTMPEDTAPGDAIRESLTPARKSYLTSFSAPRPASKPGPISKSMPVTAGVFASKRAVPVEDSPGKDVELPLAHPAPPGSAPTPPTPAHAAALTPSPPAQPEPAGERERTPKRRIEDLEERIRGLEQKGTDIAAPRRFVGLAKSFLKGGNTAKAEQYLGKAVSKLEELEKEAGPAKAGPACRKCGTAVDPTWIVCPECEAKLK